jgi:hypothetical protein
VAGSPRQKSRTGVPELARSTRSTAREVADLVAAGADVPRLGDELHLGHRRVLLDQVEERREPVDVVELPGQRRGEVESEAVDVHLGDPVAQRIHDQLQRLRRADVERVPGARVVHVVLLVVLDQPVVRGVVDALERQRGPEVVALGGVVVDDVEDDLDARLVQGAHHALELLHVLTGRGVAGVLVVRREEADRVVAPVVAQALLLQGVVLDELVHRHELDRGDAEVGEVLDRRRVRDAPAYVPRISSGMFLLRNVSPLTCAS